MTFDLTPTAAQHDLARRAHEFAENVIRPVALEYDQKQEFPWPVLEEAAQAGFYSPLFYRDLIGDPPGLSLPMFMEELFWGCAALCGPARRPQPGGGGARGAGRRQRRPQSADHGPPRRQRLDPRRPQD